MSTSTIIYIDMDGVLCNFKKAHSAAVARMPEIRYPQTQFDFFRKLEPMEGALEAVQGLVAQPNFEGYILTAPSIYNPLSYTEKRLWVEDHLGMDLVKRLIVSPHKNLNKGHFLIDDRPHGNGQDLFEGKLLLFGAEEFPDWDAVLAFFKQESSL